MSASGTAPFAGGLEQTERFSDLQTALRAALDGHQGTMWTCEPGIVVSYDPVKVTVQVQPAIMGKQLQPDGTTTDVKKPVLPDVPVHFAGAGGYTLTHPIAEGDECLVVFAHRCIDNWHAQGGVQPQFEHRMHDLSDGFALFRPQSQAKKIANISTTTTQLRSDDGLHYIEVDQANGRVHLKSGTKITIEAPLTEITGTLRVLNQAGANPAVQVTGDLHTDTVSSEHHVHLNTQPGAGLSGQPQP